MNAIKCVVAENYNFYLLLFQIILLSIFVKLKTIAKIQVVTFITQNYL